jgi:hypothetical protein
MTQPTGLPRGDAELVGVAETAARLKVSAERIRQLAKSGEMPSPVGRLGRQLVWQWRDVENWARQEGRLPGSQGAPKRVTQRDSGSLKLVVDELMSWGRRDQDVCHVRVWAPTSERGSHVVLLGQLQDHLSRSITNEIENVAMTAAVRYVGATWRQAQFYEYRPPSGIYDNEVEFHHVTFTVEPLPTGRRRRDVGEVAVSLGGSLAHPSWRRTDRDELAELTGDVPAIWVCGTYTRDVLATTADLVAPMVIWDPLRARDVMDLIDKLTLLRSAPTADHCARFGVALDLEPHLTDIALTVARQGALEALAHSEQDVRTQPVDAAITLTAVQVVNPSLLPDAARLGADADIDPHAVWETLSRLRRAVVDARAEQDPDVVRRRRILVPGRCSGFVELPWWAANVDERSASRHGLFGPIAAASDVVTDDTADREAALPFERLLLLDALLSEHLEQYWPDWGWHNTPAFTPSEALPVDGPLTRRYLGSVRWRPLAEVDPDRLHRLARVLDVTRAGYDPDGRLVVANKRVFACEWPVSSEEDPTLADALIRADRPNPRGATAVFLQRGEALMPLPSSPHRSDGNAYTWGYSGTGPANLADAVLDVCWRAGVLNDPHSDRWTYPVHSLVARPRTPDWRVGDVLDLAAGVLAIRGGRPQ